ncbi:Clan CE, family C48, Ulp1-like cysteine peptidase [Trichomonas vaginalis G3]|uniref:Clan CE, family C48, Ulp1-like cysteine peptidase n=1 Tax=Trichomonas vaginalis (strain ATCC PRA-98 / G3) TaxID=412133 RepID=A2FRM7_TRIV3|nr:Clan CE, family C48, Ulp1-like cysteine peptidase [Trichomonas vaginalis G3]EAX92446.1 Clan CE, family C48, Ulp1-like cysteine peptidase [Trichomonas vaginalis G3]KAI5482953.1 Clan CE, family C48, Ulp1-like cysteine peptidase [Trichomonas vaginalis G3]|eukprot:XP_001305376.1 Clan CE, family C48, Ulp1-like cysteine peptidase [Trichomonas vaginalis G3]
MIHPCLSSDALNDLKNKMPISSSVINYFCSKLRNKFKDHPKSFYFMEPNISSFIFDKSVEFSRDFMKTRDVKSNDIVFIFLYNNAHFSLLCYMPKMKKQCFIHLDSLKNAHHQYALEFTNKFINIFEAKCNPKTAFAELGCPQQNNDYDCGIYSCAFVDLIASNFTFNKKIFETITPTYISKLRGELFSTITSEQTQTNIEIPCSQPNPQVDQS